MGEVILTQELVTEFIVSMREQGFLRTANNQDITDRLLEIVSDADRAIEVEGGRAIVPLGDSWGNVDLVAVLVPGQNGDFLVETIMDRTIAAEQFRIESEPESEPEPDSFAELAAKVFNEPRQLPRQARGSEISLAECPEVIIYSEGDDASLSAYQRVKGVDAARVIKELLLKGRTVEVWDRVRKPKVSIVLE